MNSRILPSSPINPSDRSAFPTAGDARRPLFGALWVFAAVTLVRNFHHTKAYGWTLSVERESWRFVAVDPTGPDAGRLEPGDRLLSLNGDPRAAVLGALFFVNAPIEGVYRVEIDRYRQRKAYDMLMPAGPGRQLWLVFLTVSLAFFACGAALGRLRPQDAQVRLIAVLLTAAACTMILEVRCDADRRIGSYRVCRRANSERVFATCSHTAA